MRDRELPARLACFGAGWDETRRLTELDSAADRMH